MSGGLDLWPPCSCCLLSSRCQVMPWPSDAGAVGCPRLPLPSTGTSCLNRIEKPYAQQGHKREQPRIRLIGTHQHCWSSGGGWEILYAFALTGPALPLSSGLCQTPRSLRLYLLSSPSRYTTSLQAVRRVLDCTGVPGSAAPCLGWSSLQRIKCFTMGKASPVLMAA